MKTQDKLIIAGAVVAGYFILRGTNKISNYVKNASSPGQKGYGAFDVLAKPLGVLKGSWKVVLRDPKNAWGNLKIIAKHKGGYN